MSSKTKPVFRRELWLLPVVVIGLIAALLPLATVPASQAAPSLQGGTNLTWTNVQNSPGVFWYTLSFPTDQIGYASGGPDWNLTENGPITIAKTLDGGAHWIPTVLTFDGSSRLMRGLGCKDANTCLLAGGSYPRIFQTTNGGSQWTPLDNPYNGYLWSAAYTGQGATALIGTTGHFTPRQASWIRAANGTNFGLVASPDEAGIVQWDIECPDPGICFSASLGRVYYSNTDGASWVSRPVPSTLTTRFYGLSCINATTCWMVGNRQRIVYTTNSGVTWQGANVEPVGGAFPLFWDIDMVDSQHGYAVGCTNSGVENSTNCLGEGMIFRTDDGVNWFRIPNPASTTANLMDINVFSMDDIVVLEWTGKIWRGSIPPTATPTPTDTPTNTPTNTPTPTRTPTPTTTPTNTPTPTATPSVGIVQGIAFYDENDNLLQDNGEIGLAGAVMALKQGDTTVNTATSNDNGAFAFGNIQPGVYTLVEQTPPAGYDPSPSLMTFTIPAGASWSVFVPHRLYTPPPPTPTPIVYYCGYVPLIQKGSTPGQ